MAEHFSQEDLERISEFTEAMRLATQGVHANVEANKTEEQRARDQAIKAAKIQAKKIEEAFDVLGKGVSSFHSSTTQIGGGQRKYASGVKDATGALGDMIMMINHPVAKGLALFVKGLGLATEGVTKQNDKVIEAYDMIGKFGGVSTMTSDRLLRLGLNAQYTSHNLDVFAKASLKVAPQLVALGGTVGRGIEAFSDIASLTDDQIAQYRRLGMSQDDLLENQASYMKYQTDSGRFLTKDTAKLREQTLLYTNNLIDLAAITGNDVERQKQNQAAMTNDLKYQISQRQLIAEGSKESLEKADRMKAVYERLMNEIPVEQAKAFAAYLSTGIMEGEAQFQLLQLTSGNIAEYRDQILKGTMNADDLTKALQAGGRAVEKTLGPLAQLDGIAEKFGLSLKLLSRTQTVENAKSMAQAAREREAKMREENDRRLALQIQLEKTERKARSAQDEFYLLMSNAVNPALQALAWTTEKLNVASAGVLRFFNKLIGDGIESSAEGKPKLDKIRTERDSIFAAMQRIEKEKPKDYAQDSEYQILLGKRNKILQDEADLVARINVLKKQEHNNLQALIEQQYNQAKLDKNYQRMAELEFQRMGKTHVTQTDIDKRVKDITDNLAKASGSIEDILKDVKLPEAKGPDLEVVGGKLDQNTIPVEIKETAAKVKQFDEDLKNVQEEKRKIEEKLKKATTGAEKTQANQELDIVKMQVKEAETKLNSSNLAAIAARNRARTGPKVELTDRPAPLGSAENAKYPAPVAPSTATPAVAPAAAPAAGGPSSTTPDSTTPKATPAPAKSTGTQKTTQPAGASKKVDLSGLRIKSPEAIAGGDHSESLVTLAYQIQEALGVDLKYFSGLNDIGRDKNSKHTSGQAIDIVLNNPEKYGSTLDLIKGMNGVSFAQFERAGQKNPNGSVASGDHIHAEVAMADGGILKSQPGGTLVQAAEAGVNEAFVPLPKGKKIPVSMPSLDKLVNSNLSLKEDLKLLMGGSDTNSPLVNAMTDKLAAKMDPQKLLLDALIKNVPAFGKAMMVNNIAGIAGGEEMSTAEKILEIAKLLNPTVRLVSKLYDTYQTVQALNSNTEPAKTITPDLKPFGDMVNTMADSFKTKPNTSLPDVNGLIKAQIEQQQTSQQELVTKLSTAMTPAVAQAPNNDGTREMVELLSDKLNTMIDKLDSSNDTQAKILQEARN